MNRQLINIGTVANDSTGDSLRTAFTKVNQNFDTLFTTSVPMGPPGSVQYRSSAVMTDIAYLDSVYVAIGSPDKVYTSPDLVSWSRSTTAPIGLNAIIATSTLLMGVGASGLITTSTDGIVWTLVTSGSTADLKSVAFDGTNFVAVGTGGIALISTDGTTWSAVTSSTTDNLSRIVYVDDLLAWVAVGDSGTIITSANGSTWVVGTSNTTSDLRSAEVYLNTVIVVGNSGTILESQDLVNWSIRNSGTTVNLAGVAFIGDNAIVVGANGTIRTSEIATGLGFITWVNTVYPSTTTADLSSVRTIGTTTIALGSAGTMISLVAGGAWTDVGVSTGIEGDSSLVFDPTGLLSIDASIIPITDDTWTIGNATNRFSGAHFSDVLSVGGIELSGDGVELSLNKQSDGLAANLLVGDLVANSVTANEATFTELNATNFSVASLSVTDLITDDITATSVITDTVITDSITSTNVFADTVTADTFFGDGGNLTGLPVHTIIAGTNVTVVNNAGVWTISSTSGGGGGGGGGTTNSSHLPLNSIQIADVGGTFNSDSRFTYDPTDNKLSVVGGIVEAQQFIGNFTGGDVSGTNATFTGNVSLGNLTVSGIVDLGAYVVDTANLGNIRIFDSNIMAVGAPDFVINANTANLAIYGANSTVLNANAKSLLVSGGNVVGDAVGGAVTVRGGSGGSAGHGGALSLWGGNGGHLGDGGNVEIRGGDGGFGGTGGAINIISGVTNADSGVVHGANLYLQAGNAINEDAGILNIQGGNATGAMTDGGNIRITAGVGTRINGNIFIGNVMWPASAGTVGTVLSYVGGGQSQWVDASSMGVVVSSLANGTSNVSIDTADGNVGISVDGVANVMKVTPTTVLANSFTSNNFVLGDGTTTACITKWLTFSTNSNAPNQVIYSVPAGTQISTDFKIISYDMPASNRQSSMITSVTYGTQTSYSEFATTTINSIIADFSVVQSGGQIRLLVSPRVAHLIKYTIIVSSY